MVKWHIAPLRFAPAFRALGVCEHSWLRYNSKLYNINCTKCRASFLYEMSGFVFVRNVRFRFCTKCLVSLLYEMSGFGFCTRSRVYEMPYVRIVVPPVQWYPVNFCKLIFKVEIPKQQNIKWNLYWAGKFWKSKHFWLLKCFLKISALCEWKNFQVCFSNGFRWFTETNSCYLGKRNGILTHEFTTIVSIYPLKICELIVNWLVNLNCSIQ